MIWTIPREDQRRRAGSPHRIHTIDTPSEEGRLRNRNARCSLNHKILLEGHQATRAKLLPGWNYTVRLYRPRANILEVEVSGTSRFRVR